MRRQIGLAGQSDAVDDVLIGRQNLMLIGRLNHLPAATARLRADELLQRFSLTDAAARKVAGYSGGMRRPLDLAAALRPGPTRRAPGLGVSYPGLAFLAGVITTCEVCQGSRFHQDALRHTVRGKNIGDVLAMSVAEAGQFFGTDSPTERAISKALQRLSDVGLDYLGLGQVLPTLSGGDRQRLKLAMELGAVGQVYVLDEPTTGLHASDVEARSA